VSEDLTAPAAEMAPNSEVSDSLDPAIVAVIQSEVERRTSEISEQFTGKSKALNHELAQLRRKLKKTSFEHVEQAASNGDSVGDQLSRADVNALIQVGQLQAGLPSDTVERIHALELSPTQEAAILGAIIDGTKNQPARAARDARSITRGTTSAPRESAQLPASQQEWNKLYKSDPKRFKELGEDPSFDPSDLPYRA